MSLFNNTEFKLPIFFQFRKGWFRSGSLMTHLLLGIIPPVVIILIGVGYITYLISCRFIGVALERTANLQAMVLAHEVEGFLARCRQDLIFISQEKPDPAKLRDFLAKNRCNRGIAYCGLAYISQKDDSHLLLAANEDEVVQIPREKISGIRPNLLLFYDQIKNLKKDEVWISGIVGTEYPFPSSSNPNQEIISTVIYFGMPYIPDPDSEDKDDAGYLLLSLDVRNIRDILSFYSSPRSPLWVYPARSPQVLRYSYLFDTEGWILFQSEGSDKGDTELKTDLVRSVFTGTMGMPNLPCGFRPGAAFGNYWKMVEDIREGKQGLIKIADPDYELSGIKEYYLAYTPVRFIPGQDAPARIYAGIAYVDRSMLTVIAGYKQMDVMFILTLLSVLIVSLLIYFLSRMITRPILKLSEAVNAIPQTGNPEEIRLSASGYEVSLLQNAINAMIAAMERHKEEIRRKDREIETFSLRQKAAPEQDISEFSEKSGIIISGIVGIGEKIESLKSDILKAAQSDADVLIIGETGTGKQLTSEAVHQYSRRAGKPFISINCGELSENLLSDTLFGHVKGAFTEAKTDRKGAFLEADGGTLFLDEIQTASSGIQQALLRAISMRKIKPLGSDKEIDVDVRLITATNADLSALIAEGLFRSDLYFRLKVVTLHTPALRDQKENIPVLAAHFLRLAEIRADKIGFSLSKGALAKMKQYHWPGNVRELMNCIIRAVVMAEDKVIQAEDILTESEKAVRSPEVPAEIEETLIPEFPDGNGGRNAFSEAAIPADMKSKMKRRQEKAYQFILMKGGISRSEYQNLIGGDISSRTAVYDLQDMVKKGLVRKTGQGPATRYVLPDA